MRKTRVWKRLLGLGAARITKVELEGDVLVAQALPIRRRGARCGRCGRPHLVTTVRVAGGIGERSILVVRVPTSRLKWSG